MKRRDVLQWLASAAAAAPYRAVAQTTAKTYRLAALTSGGPMGVTSPNGALLFPALAARGYILGKNLEYHPYGAAMQADHLPKLASDIVTSKVDAVIVGGYPAAAAMKGSGVPTVAAVGAGDPVATHLVASLSLPEAT